MGRDSRRDSNRPAGPSGAGAEFGLDRTIGRRGFVRTASGLFVAAAFGTGCGEVGDAGTGTVRVRINGLANGLASAGSVTITGSGLTQPLVVQLPALTQAEVAVPVGSYQIVYQPPGGYTIAAGGSNQAAATIVEGELTEVQFTVVAASGVLRLTITGTPAGSVNSGSAQVSRVDVPGQAPLAVIIPLAGVVDVSVVPAEYSVDYAPPSGAQLIVGQVDPRSAVVTANQTTSVGYTIESSAAPPPPPAGVLFHSDFSTATGTSSAALRDTSKANPWDLAGGQGLDVIASTGLDFPCANVLRVTATAASSGFATLRNSGMPLPANGQSRWYRFYARYTFPDGLEDQQTHPVQDGGAGSQINWEWAVLHNLGGNGRFTPSLQLHSNNPFADYRWNPTPLNKGQTYRYEWQILRVSDTTFQMHVRIYDSAGTLVLSDADYRNEGNTRTLAAVPTPTMLFNNVNNLDGLNAGCNGISGTNPPFPFVYGYQSAFAVSGTDWIGPYAGGI
jgi:hypothetical protein